MNRLSKLAALEAKRMAQRPAFVRECIRELRAALIEADERDARYLEETGRPWEPPPLTPEQREGVAFIEEIVAEWQANQGGRL